MALQITHTDGIYEINGDLNSQNVLSLNNYFETAIERSKMITLSLHNLIDIDKTAVAAIAALYKKAMSYNKVFYILGEENPTVSAQFKQEKLGFILRRDVL